MNVRAPTWILVAIISLMFCCSNVNEQKEVEALAFRVHEQMRAGDFASIYRDSETRFKTVGTESEFVRSLKGFQEQLGNFKHAETVGYEIKFDSRGKTHELHCELEYEHGRAREDLTIVRSATGQMQLWSLEIQPLD